MTTLGERIDRKIEAAKNSTLAQRERQKVLLYYNRVEPKRQHDRQSPYISTDVYDGVEGMKAQIDDVVNTGREILQFVPQGPQDVRPARVATAYTNYVFFRQNNGRKIIQTVVDDALKGHNGFCKVYWRSESVEIDENFEAPTEAALALYESPGIEAMDAEIDEDSGIATGTITRLVNRSQVIVEPIAAEDFGIDPRATCIDDAFHYVRALMTRAELTEAGFDVAKLKDLSPDGPTIDREDTEKDARFVRVDGGAYDRHNLDSTDDTPFWVYECYDHLTPKAGPKAGKRGLYKITRVSNVTLDIEEVDRSPVKVYTPLPNAHSFMGNCFGALLIPAQTVRTTLARAVVDHTALATNPRYMVAKGGLPNPRELLQGQFGGIVNVDSVVESIAPVPQPALNQFVFPIMDMIKSNAEQTTGLSALSLGLNKDVISNQNSQALVQDQVDLAMTRQKTLIRNLCHGFLRDVFLEIHRLVLENEDRKNVIEVAGEYVDVDPRRFIERKECEVVLHLTPNDAQAEASKYMNLMSQAAQDPGLAGLITTQNKYNLATKIMQTVGIKDFSSYITPPDQIPPPQPDPMVVQQMELAKMQAESGRMAAQATLLKAQTDQQHKAHQEQIAELQAQLNAARSQADAMRKDMEAMSRIDLAQREQHLNEAMAQTSPGNLRGISSPDL